MIAQLPFCNAGINSAQPVNWSHPLNRGLLSWHLCLPADGRKGFRWLDLCHRSHAVLTNMDPGSDWLGPRGRVGGWGSIDFDGSNDHCFVSSYPFIDGAAGATLACWFRTGSAMTNKQIVGLPDASSGTNGIDLNFQNATSVRFWLKTGATSNGLSATVTYNDNVWHHIAGTYDGTTRRLFFDGIQVANDFRSGTITASAKELNIGRFGSFGNYYVGQADDVRIANRAYSAEEVRRLYELSRTGYQGLLNRVRRVRSKAGSAATSDGAGGSSGAAAVSGVGASLFSGVVSAAGVTTANGAGASLVAGLFASAGVGEALAIGSTLFAGVGASAGVGAAGGAGASLAAGVFASAGLAEALAIAGGVVITYPSLVYSFPPSLAWFEFDCLAWYAFPPSLAWFSSDL